MLLKSLTATNSQGSVLSLPLEDISGGFVVRSIDGLGPVKATLVSSSFANMDGEQYHSSRREARNLTVKLGLDPDYGLYSVYDLRAELYKFFMPKTEVQLTFQLFDKFSPSVIDRVMDLDISGRIESFEPDLFTNEPSVDLSIICYDPEFVDLNSKLFEGSTVDDLTETTLDYKGSVETAIIFRIKPVYEMADFTIYQRTADNSLRSVHYTTTLLDNDQVEINSNKGSKYVKHYRNGVETSVLHSITAQSNWLELMPGENHFRVYSDVPFPADYSIEYLTKYGGL